ncbi:MAG: CBS domain-containing protein [Paenisporosarcina sp.]
MEIKKVMTRDIVTCSPNDLVPEIAQSMQALDIGCMPVMEQQRVIGMITDRDIATRSDKNNKQQLIKDVMTAEIISVGPNASTEEAADIMAQHRIRRLPIIKEDTLIGFVALADLAISQEIPHNTSFAIHPISGLHI